MSLDASGELLLTSCHESTSTSGSGSGSDSDNPPMLALGSMIEATRTISRLTLQIAEQSSQLRVLEQTVAVLSAANVANNNNSSSSSSSSSNTIDAVAAQLNSTLQQAISSALQSQIATCASMVETAMKSTLNASALQLQNASQTALQALQISALAQSRGIYIAGGAAAYTLAQVLFYNLDTRELKTASSMISPRHAAFGGKFDNKIVVYGGSRTNGADFLATGESFSPATNLWTARTTTPMPDSRHYAAAGTSGSKFYVFGGYLANGSNTATVMALDLNLGSDVSGYGWSYLRPLTLPRRGSSAVLHNNATFYVMGGASNIALMERYDIQSDTWATESPLPVGLASETPCAVSNGTYIFVFSGCCATNSTAARYNTSTKAWTMLSPRPAATASYCNGAVIKDNIVYVVDSAIHSYDILRDQWTLLANIPPALNARFAVVASSWD